MRRFFVVALALASAGCTLMPKVEIRFDPLRRDIVYRTAQETDLVVGPVEYTEKTDGTRTFKAGTATQPALTYGSEAVGVIRENVAIIDAYTRLHAQLGANTDAILKDIPAIISAAEWIGGVITGLGNASAAVKIQNEIVDPLTRLKANLEALKDLANTNCAGGTCPTSQ